MNVRKRIKLLQQQDLLASFFLSFALKRRRQQKERRIKTTEERSGGRNEKWLTYPQPHDSFFLLALARLSPALTREESEDEKFAGFVRRVKNRGTDFKGCIKRWVAFFLPWQQTKARRYPKNSDSSRTHSPTETNRSEWISEEISRSWIKKLAETITPRARRQPNRILLMKL